MPELNKEIAMRYLSPVPEQNRFWCKDGKVFSNLEEFQIGLNSMHIDVFKFHVNDDRNDFSTWIYDVIGDTELAKTLRKCNDKKTTIKRVRSRVSYLKTLLN